MNQELNPLERAVQSEGEQLLARLQQGQAPQNTMLGPDGNPLPQSPEALAQAAKEAQAKQQEAQAQATAAAQEQMQARLRAAKETQRKEIEAVSELWKEVTGDSQVADKCAQTILAAHKLIYWAKLELELCDQRIGAKELFHLDQMLAKAAYNSTGCTAHELLCHLRTSTLRFLTDRCAHYEQRSKNRLARIKPVLKKLQPGGLTFPWPEANQQLSKPFYAGLYLFHGPLEALQATLQGFGRVYLDKLKGDLHYLSTAALPVANNFATRVITTGWWKSRGRSLATLHETLQPVEESKALVLCIENLNDLFAGDESAPPSQLKAQALSFLYQWAIETHTIILVGDPDTMDAQFYGRLPHCAVNLQDGKVVCSAPPKAE